MTAGEFMQTWHHRRGSIHVSRFKHGFPAAALLSDPRACTQLPPQGVCERVRYREPLVGVTRDSGPGRRLCVASSSPAASTRSTQLKRKSRRAWAWGTGVGEGAPFCPRVPATSPHRGFRKTALRMRGLRPGDELTPVGCSAPTVLPVEASPSHSSEELAQRLHCICPNELLPFPFSSLAYVILSSMSDVTVSMLRYPERCQLGDMAGEGDT